MLATETEFATISNREFWVTSDGSKIYPSEFEDGHLINTIRLLNRKANEYRLGEVRRQVELAFNITHDKDFDDQNFYDCYRKLTKFYYDNELDDMEWLKQNSKIYNLFLEEAKFRKLDWLEQDNYGTRKKKVVAKRIPMPTLWA